MKIKEILYQNRRDFRAVFVCQFCGHEETMWGYDDDNFHRRVIPNKKCSDCNKSIAENENEINEEYRPLTTKYAPWQVV